MALIAIALLVGVVLPRRHSGARAPLSPAEQHYRTGIALAQAGNGARAVAEWNLAIAMDPVDSRPYDALDGYWEETGRPDLAAGVLERLAQVNPTAPHRDCRLARAAFAAGWVSRAAEAADRAVRDEPQCPLAHTLRGIVLDDAGETAAALAELTTAHTLSPQDDRITLTLAQLEGRAGRRAAAVGRVREILKRGPQSPQAHYLMGWLEAHATPHTPAADADAVRHLRQVLAQAPEHGGALAELGALYARQGQFSRARRLLQAAQAQDPGDPTLMRNLALTEAHLGDPHAPVLAAAARRLEEQQQRRRALRRRHRRHPDDAGVTLGLARLEMAEGQTREAEDLTRQILRADPNNRGALELIHELLEPAPSTDRPPGR